jgi:hypothetical protein
VPGPNWQIAFDVIHDRIDTRFLEPTRLLIGSRYEYAGFAVLALDAVVIETIQRLRKGLRSVEGESRNLVTEFLRTAPGFSRYFPPDGHVPARECPCTPCDFYRNVRSGVTHDGETHNGWLVRYGGSELLVERGGVRLLDRNLFHRAVETEFESYLNDLAQSRNALLRAHLKAALDGICSDA